MPLALEWKCCEIGQITQRDIDLARGAARAEVLDRGNEVIRKILLLHELQEGALRVRGGHYDFGVEFVTVFKDNTYRTSVLDLDMLHACVDSDLHSECF